MKKLILITLILVCYFNKNTTDTILKKISPLDSLLLKKNNEKKFLAALDSAREQCTKDSNTANEYLEKQDSLAEAEYQISNRTLFLEKNKLENGDPSLREKLKELDEADSRAENIRMASHQKALHDFLELIQKAKENYQAAIQEARKKYP